MTNTFYVLQCTANNCQVEFYLNDIPVALRGGHKGHFVGVPVNQYLVDRENILSIVVSPGPKPSESKTGPNGVRSPKAPPGSALVILAKYPKGSTIGGPDGEEITSIEWPPHDDGEQDETQEDQEEKGDPDLFPLEIVRKFDIGKLFGSWEWQRAPRIDLDDDVRDEIVDFLKILGVALSDGDPEPFIKSSAIRLTETAKAYEKSPTDTTAVIRHGVRQDSGQKWWGIEPFDPKKLDFRLCADGRMVDCVNKDWEASLRELEDDEGGRGYYNMLVSKIGDQWQIVR